MSEDTNDTPGSSERRPRRDADKGREPQFVAGRFGARMFSLAALVEKVIAQFVEEYGEDFPALREADTTPKRLRLILDVVNYMLAVDSIDLTAEGKAELIRRVYSDLFGYGPLDALFLDDRVTTISIEGAEKASVRYGNSALTSLGTLFDDEQHLRRAITRLLIDAGTELREDTPIMETGLMVEDRPVRISVVSPPYAFALSADIRVHPRRSPTLAELVEQGMMSAEGAALISGIIRSKYGFCIVGEPESGKTVLLNALLNLLPEEGGMIVERAAELRIGDGVKRLTVRWGNNGEPPVTFGHQIGAALDAQPTWIALDEIRSDEPESIAPLLERDSTPRQIWSVRGVADAKRLQSSLGMLARRANMGQGELMVHRLYERLPFVITVARIGHAEIGTALRLFSVAEWQARVDSDYPDYRLLMHFRDGRAQRTDAIPARWLDSELKE